MIITTKFSRNKEVEGVKQTHNNGNNFYTRQALVNYVVYLIQPKGEETEVITPETRVKHLYSSLNIPVPVEYLKDIHDRKKAIEIAEDFVDKWTPEFERRKALYVAHGNTVNEEIPIAQEFIFAFIHDEVKDFKTDEEMAAFMIECGKHFTKEYTGFDIAIHEGLLKPHLKRDDDDITKYQPDMHLLQMPLDVNGKLLPLNPQTIAEKIGLIHYEMEQLPQFARLEKTRTNAWKNNGKLEKLEVKQDLISLLDEIFDNSKFDADLIKERLKEQGISIMPIKDKNQQDDFEIRYLNKVFNKTALTKISKKSNIKSKVFSYLKLKTFYEKNPMIKPEILDQIKKITEEFKGKPIEDLATELRNIGVALVPNINKNKGKIDGFSFALRELQGNSFQASVLNFNAASYMMTNHSGTKLAVASTIFLNSKEKQEQMLLGMPQQSITVDGEIYVRDAFGNYKALKKTKEIKAYVHWSSTGDEPLSDFITRMILSAGNNKQSPLLKLLVDENNKNLLLNSFNRKVVLEKIPEGIRCYQARNRFVVESAIDAFIAQNPLTEAQKADGYVLTMRIEAKSQEAYDIAWLEAKKKGVHVTNGQPTPAVLKKFEDLCEQKANLYRKVNIRRIEKLKTSVDSNNKYKALRMQHYKRLGNDVDRKSLRLAFIDAFYLGVDTTYIINPPRTHKFSTAKLRVEEIKEFQNEMIEIVKKEKPERLKEFQLEMDKYLKVDSGGGELRIERNKNVEDLEREKKERARRLEELKESANTIQPTTSTDNKPTPRRKNKNDI